MHTQHSRAIWTAKQCWDKIRLPCLSCENRTDPTLGDTYICPRWISGRLQNIQISWKINWYKIKCLPMCVCNNTKNVCVCVEYNNKAPTKFQQPRNVLTEGSAIWTISRPAPVPYEGFPRAILTWKRQLYWEGGEGQKQYFCRTLFDCLSAKCCYWTVWLTICHVWLSRKDENSLSGLYVKKA